MENQKDGHSIKPGRLQPGDTIAIVSPSWGGAGAFPHRVEQAIQHIHSLGFQVRLAPHALNQLKHVSDTPENRAQDINQMFADPQVKMILAAIGGDHSCQLLPHLDYNLIRNHPKIFMGFSDITVLNVALWSRTGLVTFNGPALLTDFAEYPRMQEYSERNFLKVVTDTQPAGVIFPSPGWTEEYSHWPASKELERQRHLLPSPGWLWLRSGFATGRLIGGCIESLQHLRGTGFWPDWRDAIFFFETSEDKPSPETVDGILADYENMGVLDQIKGMLVGRPMRYSEDEKRQLHEVILERTQAHNFPIIAEMDFGHTSPQFTLPIGCQAHIDAENRCFEILESAVI
jgi:muramoyltetrapeptide carboxypeptidase LdcA involved in peptidoglycan recycling